MTPKRREAINLSWFFKINIDKKKKKTLCDFKIGVIKYETEVFIFKPRQLAFFSELC